MGVIPINGVERVVLSCSIARAAFMKMILVSVSFDIIFYSTEVLASLTRRGTSHDQFYVRFPYTYFSRHVAFPTKLNTVGTKRNRQRLTDTRVGDVARVTKTGRDKQSDRQTDKHTNFEGLGCRCAHNSISQPPNAFFWFGTFSE